MLTATVFIWCQLKYAAIIMIFYWRVFFSALGQNVWVSSTTFLLIKILKRQIAEMSSACVLSKGLFIWAGFGRGKDDLPSWVCSPGQGGLQVDPTSLMDLTQRRLEGLQPHWHSIWWCAVPCDVAVASVPHPPPRWECGQATSVASTAI